MFIERLLFLVFMYALLKILLEPRPIVTTLNGQLEGTVAKSGFFHSYYSFKGIPYAEPPIEKLRFRNPVPHKPWSVVRDASRHGNHCPTNIIKGLGVRGNEDCLFLNVYTPALIGNLSVMVWIHGGAFAVGDGDDFIYGPDLLVREDVIVVTINYRLSSLGFLGTGDRNAQGNYGLKDIVLALQWVQQNIAAFGGNPDKVTIFGQSAGSIAIHLLMVTGKQEGLFHHAIMQTGTVLTPFIFQKNPLRQAEELGYRLGINFNSTEDLVEQLRAVNFKDILKSERSLFEMDVPLGLRVFDFVLCAEPPDSEEEIFLSDDPTNLLLNENHKINIPLIIGTTSNEGLLMVREYLLDSDVFDRYNQNEDYLVPLSFNLDKNTSSNKEVASKFRDVYFNGQKVSRKTLEGYARYHTDAQFKFPTDRSVKIIAKTSTQPIFYYNFSFSGALNLMKSLLFLGNYPGACHGDELFYLFKMKFPLPIWPTNHALTVRRRHVRLFTNFAKYGNPTPETDDLITQSWPQYERENEAYLDIGHDLKVENHQEGLNVWHAYQQRFTGHL